MDDRTRAERGLEIQRRLAAGEDPRRIFPPLARHDPPPPAFADGHADFFAIDIPSPDGGSTMRSYIWDCAHAKQELSLLDRTAEQDGEVLGHMQSVVRRYAPDCLCWPRGWAAA